MRPDAALAAWTLPAHDAPPSLSPVEGGLINRTYLVGEPPTHVLQWVNPIFDPRIHHDMMALVARLREKGMPTPELVATTAGEPYLADGRALTGSDPTGRDGSQHQDGEPRQRQDGVDGVWRLLTYVPGSTVHRLGTIDRAEAAGRLVGRFHAALAGWEHDFVAPQRPIHETPARLAELGHALERCTAHPLAVPARSLGAEILAAWNRFDGQLDLPERICHGDLKISNLRFDSSGTRGICLIDLDTVGPMDLACEMGDAWRSWCNPKGEADPDACYFDVELFAASARGWVHSLDEAGVELADEEWTSLVPGIERICLELSARFCADAVRNDYFLEDRQLYPEPGTHNLVRARCQLALARSARAERVHCEGILEALRR